MTCPACGNALASGHERCAFCGALVAPSAEGALAPDHASVTPPGRGRADAPREMGGFRKPQRSWKDEVNDRMRHRRQRKPGGPAELPLFAESLPPRDAWVSPSPEPRSTRSESGRQPEPADHAPRPVERDTQPLDIGSRRIEAPRESVEEAELTTPALNATDLGDLPLNPAPVDALPDLDALPEPLAPPARVIERLDPGKLERELAAARAALPDLDEEPLVSSDEEGWPLELSARPRTAPPVERPAFGRERAMAAGLDFALMLGAALVVVYFAGRAARVPLQGLLPTWPWLLGYLALLGLVYAGYFTGATGQTLGKMATGLRVVDRAGQPPGFLRAFARGILGTLSVAIAGLGLLPMLFDPARRALHDRVFRMRVVRR